MLLRLAKQEKPWEGNRRGSGHFYTIKIICKETQWMELVIILHRIFGIQNKGIFIR